MVGNVQYRTQYVGRAGEFRVMSELMLRGHNPSMPAIDTGGDVVIENGIRIQVKTSQLTRKGRRPQYSLGYYRFYLGEYKGNRIKKRDWSLDCDFFVFWCLDEDRFFIAPPSAVQQNWIIIAHKSEPRHIVINVEAARQLRAKGMSIAAIARELGVSFPTVKEHLNNERQRTRNDWMTKKILQYEDRWDLLDVNSTTAPLVESAIVTEKEKI
jgi:hypothetical protein